MVGRIRILLTAWLGVWPRLDIMAMKAREMERMTDVFYFVYDDEFYSFTYRKLVCVLQLI